MNAHTLAAAVLAAALPTAHAVDISISDAGSTYTQTFDTLPTTGNSNTWANGSTLAGWHLFRNLSSLVTTIAASDGTALAPSPNVSSGYKSAGSTGSTDRALGAQGATSTGGGGQTAVGFIAASFNNATTGSLDSFTLRYDGEQWRKGGTAGSVDRLPVSYGFGTSFAAVSQWTLAGSAFNFTAPVNTAGGAALDGNAAANRVANLGGTVAVDWAPGTTLWLRWEEADNTPSNTVDHFVAIDNVTLSVTAAAPVPEPTTSTLLLAGAAAIGWLTRRASR